MFYGEKKYMLLKLEEQTEYLKRGMNVKQV